MYHLLQRPTAAILGSPLESRRMRQVSPKDKVRELRPRAQTPEEARRSETSGQLVSDAFVSENIFLTEIEMAHCFRESSVQPEERVWWGQWQ